MDKQALDLLGIKSKSYTPSDVYDRINHLIREEQAANGLRRVIYLYKLDRKLQKSKTPLTDIACYWDSHCSDGSTKQIGFQNVLSLCRQLELDKKGNT